MEHACFVIEQSRQFEKLLTSITAVKGSHAKQCSSLQHVQWSRLIVSKTDWFLALGKTLAFFFLCVTLYNVDVA